LKDDALAYEKARWIEAFEKARVAAKTWDESFEKAMYHGNVFQKKLEDAAARSVEVNGLADFEIRNEISELLQLVQLMQAWAEGTKNCVAYRAARAAYMEEAAAQQQTVAASEEDIDEEDSDDMWQQLKVAVNNAKEDREAAEKKTAMAIRVVMNSGNAFMLDVEANETIDNVKAMIQTFKEDFPFSTDLVLELQGSRTLSSYNIKNGDVVLTADFRRYKGEKGKEGKQWVDYRVGTDREHEYAAEMAAAHCRIHMETDDVTNLPQE
jgi:hypothetical protein